MPLYMQRILKTLAVLLLLWLGGLCFFFFSIPNHVPDDQTTTQAVVVLTGGRERLKTGFHLLCQNRAQMIFISGVHPGETVKSLLKLLEPSGVVCHNQPIASPIYLGYKAKNTRENAQETEAWAKKMSVTSLRLVTGAYHMPRALLEFKRALPNITLITHPVFPNKFHRSHWWKNGWTFYLIFSEYHKYLWALMRIYGPRSW